MKGKATKIQFNSIKKISKFVIVLLAVVAATSGTIQQIYKNNANLRPLNLPLKIWNMVSISVPKIYVNFLHFFHDKITEL